MRKKALYLIAFILLAVALYFTYYLICGAYVGGSCLNFKRSTFLVGLIGSLITVTGAAWNEKRKVEALKSIKNWLFAVGAIFLLTYAIMGYLSGGSIFYVMIESMVIIASILMMVDANDKTDTIILSVFGLGFVTWSLYLFEDLKTLYFIVGLTGVSLGYALEMGSIKRSAALTIGSILIAIFSYTEQNWIFFWLNVFFAIFSGYYLIQGIRSHTKK